MWWVVNATPRPLYPRETPGTHCIGGWVGLRTGLDRCEKNSPLPGSDPRTVQAVESRYTDRAFPSLSYIFSVHSTTRHPSTLMEPAEVTMGVPGGKDRISGECSLW
jgi:hypothetical protein